MKDISDIGWIVIAFIAVLIFAVIMLRGISFDWNGKKGRIGIALFDFLVQIG